MLQIQHIDDNGNIVEDPEDGTRLFAWKPKVYNKKSEDYLLILLLVCKKLAKIVDKKQMVPLRLFKYI